MGERQREREIERAFLGDVSLVGSHACAHTLSPDILHSAGRLKTCAFLL